MKNVVKLTFTGDILCYAIQNKISKIGEDSYDYDGVFSRIIGLLDQSDYVCGSLETPLAGRDLGYTESPINFNTPSSFAGALKKAGIDMVTTANNHCLDRGVVGLQRTIKVLEENGIEYTGTYLTREDSYVIFVKNVGGVKISFLSYTYGTNSLSNKHFLEGDEIYLVDLLKKQDRIVPQKASFIRKCARKIKRIFFISKSINRKNRILVDSVSATEIINPVNKFYIERLESKISEAKKLSDIVVLCMHSGGQFNFNVGLGEYTNYIIDTALKNGVNLVIGNHTHCVLPARKYDNKTFVASALGNFCFTPKEGYYVDNVYADYSVLLNFNIDKETKLIESITFSILKTVLNETGNSCVYNVWDLYQEERDPWEKSNLKRENAIVVNKFKNQDLGEIEIAREYNF